MDELAAVAREIRSCDKGKDPSPPEKDLDVHIEVDLGVFERDLVMVRAPRSAGYPGLPLFLTPSAAA